MTQVTIYTKSWCPYCQAAKARANGRRTVPQIFINAHHVGGCDDLHALEDAGKLDALLAE